MLFRCPIRTLPQFRKFHFSTNQVTLYCNLPLDPNIQYKNETKQKKILRHETDVPYEQQGCFTCKRSHPGTLAPTQHAF